MARPPLPLGSWGKIRRYRTRSGTWRAITKYRDYDGRTRLVERSGASGAKAERRLIEHLTQRARVSGSAEITPDTSIRQVAEEWFRALQRKDRAINTVAAYEETLRLHVVPALGALRVRELTVGVAERFISTVQDTTGPSAARRCKTVLNGIMGLAALHEAIEHNPVRDTSAVSVVKKDARSLTLEEVRQIRLGLRADPRAVERDVPALVDFMLGTGLRIGEVLAVTWEALDLETATVEVRGTVVRQKNVGLIIQPKPKTAAGWRKLHLPAWLVVLLRERPVVDNEWNVVFPSQRGKLRDKSNTNADLRDALDPLGFGWLTSHTFRKTAATLLSDGGLTVREIADQLGHRRISVTQDTYFGRQAASPKVAAVLAAIGEGSLKSVD
jgi:integrase